MGKRFPGISGYLEKTAAKDYGVVVKWAALVLVELPPIKTV
jgi:hypothetical protein